MLLIDAALGSNVFLFPAAFRFHIHFVAGRLSLFFSSSLKRHFMATSVCFY